MVILYIPLIIFILMVITYSLKFHKYNIGLYFLNMVYLFIYGLSGFFSYYSLEGDQLAYTSFSREGSTFIITQILVFISYIFSILGYFFVIKLKERTVHSSFFVEKDIAISSFISMLLCFFFVLIYISQYGGLFNALASAAIIRSGFVEQEAKLTFVKYLMPIGVFPFLYYGQQLILKKGIVNFVLFVSSFSIVFLAFLLMGGRTRIVMYLLAFMLMYFLISKNAINLKKLGVYSAITFLSVFFIQFGKQLFLSFSNILEGEKISSVVAVNQKSFIDAFLGYFAHRTYSIETALIYIRDTNNLYWFKDNFNSLFFLIPERLTGISKPDSISFLNTQLIMGEYDSTVPPGILAYGVYSMWIPGMFMVAMFYGMVFAYLDKIYLRNKQNTLILIVVLPSIMVWTMYGSVGDVRIFINGCIYILFFVMIMMILRLMRALK